MGTVVLGAGIFILISTPNIYVRLGKFLPQRLPPALAILFLVIAIPPLWGLFGVISGLLYRLADDSFPHAGLGSSNYAFTLATLCVAFLLTTLLLITRKKLALLGLIMNAAFVGIFGWLLPLLASWR